MNADSIHKIGIIGAGLMGHGIAQEFALAGYEVRLHDLSDEKLEQATRNIQANLQRLVGMGLVTSEQAETVGAKIQCSAVLSEVVGDADFVLEAVFENLELKQNLFRELDRLCPAPTILASNTSSLLPSQLASATQRSDRVLIAHYFNPPYLLPLVEVVRGPETSEETVQTVMALLTRIGKRPALVQKEALGFIGNRLQAALLREALSIVERGIASPQDVDIVIKNGFGRRLAAAGVFEIFDIAGWDIILAICNYLLSDIESSTEVSPLLQAMVERGELGTKTGQGFYMWTPESAEAWKQKMAKTLALIAQSGAGE